MFLFELFCVLFGQSFSLAIKEKRGEWINDNTWDDAFEYLYWPFRFLFIFIMTWPFAYEITKYVK